MDKHTKTKIITELALNLLRKPKNIWNEIRRDRY